MNVLERLGIKQEKKVEFTTLLFYFMRECHFNPLDEEFILPNGKTIIKKGMSIPLFINLLKEAEKHYEREKKEMERKR